MSDDFWIDEGEMQVPVAQLKIGGRFGANNAKDFRGFCASLRDDGYCHLILDMSETTFIASAGIGALVLLTGEFSRNGGMAYFVSLSPAVQRVIDLLNLGQFLTTEKSKEAALEALKARN